MSAREVNKGFTEKEIVMATNLVDLVTGYRWYPQALSDWC